MRDVVLSNHHKEKTRHHKRKNKTHISFSEEDIVDTSLLQVSIYKYPAKKDWATQTKGFRLTRPLRRPRLGDKK